MKSFWSISVEICYSETFQNTIRPRSRYFVKNNYLRDQSLKLNAKVSFTDKSIKFNNGKLINKKTLVNFKGDLIKKNKINIVRVDF